MHSILVHATDFPVPTPALRCGARLAAKLGATLTAVFAYEDRSYDVAPFTADIVDAIEARTTAVLKGAVAARHSFLDWATSQKVPAAEWLVARGSVAMALAQAATCRDLLVLDPDDALPNARWDVSRLILHSGVPCLLTPPDDAYPIPFKRVAVAWNGSPEAMRAVHAIEPFLPGSQVLLLRGDEREPVPTVAWDPPFDIFKYLQVRRADVTQQIVDARADTVGRALLDAAAQFRANLLVMGAFGRSRFSEWVLGGATRDVLSRATLPVLMRH